MEKELKAELVQFLLHGQHEKIFKTCEYLLIKSPEDTDLMYCTAMAAITLGETKKSVLYLEKLLSNIIQAAHETVINKKRLLYLGQIAIQIPKLLEHLKDDKKAAIFHSAVECAKSISQKTGDNNLQQAADIFDSQILKTDQGHLLYILPKTPLDIQVEGTNHCNLKCTMCPRTHMSRNKGYMDIELWEKIILGWSGRNNKLEITHLVFDINFAIKYLNGSIKMFFMGEPLLHPQFDQFIKIAKKHGSRIGVQTNGVMLEKPRIRERLIKAKPDEIFLSLDGVDHVNYSNIRKGSNWRNIIESAKGLSVLRTNLGVEKDILLGVSTILPDNNQDTINKVLAFLDPIRPYVDTINGIPLIRSHAPIFFNTNGQLQQYDKQDLSQAKSRALLCEEPLKKLNILWDGTVTPCCYDIDGTIKLGDATTQNIDDIWKSKKTRSLHFYLLKYGTKKFSLCAECKNLF